jgi:CTP synthase
VGDIESHVFLEALRQFAARVGYSNIMFVHVSLVPVLGSVGEQKTKPTQHSVKELRSVGINPDVIICRSTKPLEGSTKDKLALFCQVPSSHMLTVADVSNIYHVPLMLAAQGAAEIIARRLKLDLAEPGGGSTTLTRWREIAAVVDEMKDEVRIALVGKYNGLQDSYLSVIKSLQHAAITACKRLTIDWIDAASLEPGSERDDAAVYKASWETLKAAQGVLVPGACGRALAGWRAGRRRCRRTAGRTLTPPSHSLPLSLTAPSIPRRRLRRARRRGQDPGDPLRAREQGALLRHLPRAAARRRRVRAQRVQNSARQLARVRQRR